MHGEDMGDHRHDQHDEQRHMQNMPEAEEPLEDAETGEAIDRVEVGAQMAGELTPLLTQ